MRKTPAAPDILQDMHAPVEYALRQLRAKNSVDYRHAQDTLLVHLQKLRSEARSVLPEEIDALPLLQGAFTTHDPTNLESLEITQHVIRRALLLVDHPKTEKISFSEGELQHAATLVDVPTEHTLISAGIWDMTLQRLDAATNEHRWTPDDWKKFDGEYRRIVARKNKEIIAAILVEVQNVRKQNVIVNVAFHPHFPESPDALLDYSLTEHLEYTRTVMAVRERRKWLYDLLARKNFKPKTMLRNHFRYQTDFEDAYLLVREE
jgi:hypothetical protein